MFSLLLLYIFIYLIDAKFAINYPSFNDTGDGLWDIWGRIYETGGEFTDEFKMNWGDINNQQYSHIAMNTKGMIMATWESSEDGDLWGQMIFPNATLYGEKFMVNDNLGGYNLDPCQIGLPNDKFVVVWDSDVANGPYREVYYQIINSDTSKYLPNHQLVNDDVTIGPQRFGWVSGFPNGDHVVIWMNGHSDIGRNISMCMYNIEGVKIRQNTQVNDIFYPGVFWERHSVSTIISVNKFVVVWRDNTDTSTGILAKIFNHDFSVDTPEFRVNEGFTTNDFPKTAYLINGRFAITWQKWQVNVDYDVYASIYVYNSSGLHIEKNEFLVNTNTNENQHQPSITAYDNGSFVICWTSNYQDSTPASIYAQLYDSYGNPQGSEFRVSTDSNYQQERCTVSGLLPYDKFNPNNDKDNDTLYIILGVGGGVLVIVIIIIFTILIKKKGNGNKKSNRNVDNSWTGDDKEDRDSTFRIPTKSNKIKRGKMENEKFQKSQNLMNKLKKRISKPEVFNSELDIYTAQKEF